MPYEDLRQFVKVLETKGKLHRVAKEVDKNWEIAAICRRLFRTVPAGQRPALLFDNVAGFSIPVLVGALGGSREIYALGLECTAADIPARWQNALRHPIPPRHVHSGSCKDNIVKGENVDLTAFPVPVWVADRDPGPYITAPYVCTKDPDTGIVNIGTYRVQVKGPAKAGVYSSGNHIIIHLQKNAARHAPTPCAIVIGADPVVGMASVAKIPYGTDEYAVAGGLRGAPLDLVPCETVDLAVPATAEIVIEGEIPPDREWEGPFGEYAGYMGPPGEHPYLNITCITFRNNPIYQAFFSQMPPSESSCIRQIGRELTILNHLRSLGLQVKDVHLPESGGASGIMAISMTKQYPGQVSQVMNAAWGLGKGLGKFTIVVDEDIDIRDSFALDWAMSFRTQPDKDCWIVRNMPAQGLDPSQAPANVPQHDPSRRISSVVAIDATMKHEYPPLALPPREHLEYVDRNWSKYGF
jgi:UbiD family decarboxylase